MLLEADQDRTQPLHSVIMSNCETLGSPCDTREKCLTETFKFVMSLEIMRPMSLELGS